MTGRRVLSLCLCCIVAMMVGGCGGAGKYNDTVVGSVNQLNKSRGRCVYWMGEWNDNTSAFSLPEFEKAVAAYTSQLAATKGILSSTTPPDEKSAQDFHAKLKEYTEQCAKLSALFDELTALIRQGNEREKALKGDVKEDDPRRQAYSAVILKQGRTYLSIQRCITKADKISGEARILHKRMAEIHNLKLKLENK